MVYLSIDSNIAGIKNAISSAVDNGAFGSVYRYSTNIVFIVLFLYLFYETFKLVISGGKEPIDPMKHFVKPLGFLALFYFWNNILYLINYFSFGMGQSLLSGANIESYANEMNNLLITSKVKILKDFNTFNILDVFKALDKFKQIMLIEWFSEIGMYLDKMFIYLFAAYAQIMIELLKIVSPIALALSFIPSLKSIFTTWLKSFISVNLWFGVAALIFTMINKMGSYYFKFEIGQASGLDDFDFFFAWRVGLLFVALGIFKGIMMFKVPQIISMFIGGGSSGGMFGAAFAPVMMSLAAAKGAASLSTKAVSGFKSK